MKLEDWLTQHDLSAPEFARRIGVRKMTVYRWLAGRRVPRPQHMREIASQTSGEVTANDFHSVPVHAEQEGAAA